MLAHFQEHGWVRVPAAFGAEDASAMRDVVWSTLEQRGVCRDDPATWIPHRPTHLQPLKRHPVFRAVATERTIDAIDTVLEGQPWPKPKTWGAFFLVFPTPGRPWSLATEGWHIDAPYTAALDPAPGLKIHAMFGDVEPRAGGMNVIDGSHRVVHQWFRANPPAPGTRSATHRKSLLAGAPLAELPVLENTAAAGDVILMHPLLLHAPPAAHVGTEPRFLLNKDLWLGEWPG